MKMILLASVVILTALQLYGQDQRAAFNVSGYLEAYYGYDFNKPSDHNRPGFIYSHNRHNEINLNLGFIKASYNKENIRMYLALMAGTYANANLATEPGVLKNIFEANAGLKLSKKVHLWLDAGILPSHIGFESAISKDCWALTRNIASDNTPYYETGARITYSSNGNRWTLIGLYLNGWQRISREDGNQRPAGGLQISYKPSERITLNYSNYLGTEGADSVAVRRFYNNFYGIFHLSDQFGITLGIDYGIQQQQKDSNKYYTIYSPVAIGRYQFNAKWAVTARGEYYKDENGIIILSPTASGFKTSAYSLNFDYSPVSNASVRLEGKIYDSKDRVFIRGGDTVKQDVVITTSFCVAF